MDPILTSILLILAAFLAGSIPFGYIIARLAGFDPRQTGSGNIGATNVGRKLGIAGFVLVFTLDVAKGFLPVLLLFPIIPWAAAHGSAVALGVAAILGHIFTPWLGFRGGKGVATAAGVTLALAPIPLACSLVIFLIVFVISRRVSLGSIISAISLPIAVYITYNICGWTGAEYWVLGFAVFLMLIVILTHLDNIRRLLGGKELIATKAEASSEKSEENGK